jgi:hypothetical protein
MAIFIENNYISDHYLPIHKFDSYNYLIFKMSNVLEKEKKHTLEIYKIEDGLNKNIYSFLAKYHENLNEDILNVFDNSIVKKEDKITTTTTSNTKSFSKNLVNYSTEEWKQYLKNNLLNYKLILTKTLKEKLYPIYQEDFKIFGYEK